MIHLSNIRYGYFDALRGVTMILVVFNHVMVYSLTFLGGINLFFCTFRMPLFFFVSGFFAYKVFENWNKTKVKDILIRKFKVQIIGASIFYALYTIFSQNKIPDIYSFVNPEGYWFTFTLFKIFATTVLIAYLSKIIYGGRNVFWSILFALSIFYILFKYNFSIVIPILPSVIYQVIFYGISKEYFYFMPYFALGLFARANLGKFELLISHDWIKVSTITLIILIWSLMILEYIPMVKFGIGHGEYLLSYPLGIVTLFFVIQVFYNYRHEYDRNTLFSRSIRFIGRRTLDIYFIHYFFLPDLHFLEPYLIEGNSAFLQLVIGFSVSMIIVGFSLLVGQAIRMSPLLAEWLLGVKRKSYQDNKSVDIKFDCNKIKID